MDIKERIKKVMSSVFGLNIEQINENSSKDDIETWDSLRHMALILAIEEEFDINLPDEEVGNMLNFKLIEYTVNECIGK